MPHIQKGYYRSVWDQAGKRYVREWVQKNVKVWTKAELFRLRDIFYQNTANINAKED